MTCLRRKSAASLALGLLALFFAAPAHLPGLVGHHHEGRVHPATDEHMHEHADHDADPHHPGHACECPDTPVLPSPGVTPNLGLFGTGIASALPMPAPARLGEALDTTLGEAALVDQQRPPPRRATILFSIWRL